MATSTFAVTHYTCYCHHYHASAAHPVGCGNTVQLHTRA